ncbi:MAG: tRNA lysidine(34) synthetase TilS [Deltaproteobacteria bacterium]|nr:tRNA lysidine(34) synthetase TilS [Deltaproteobacteria bacterium]
MDTTADKTETSSAELTQVALNIPGETTLPGWKISIGIFQRSQYLHDLCKEGAQDPFTAYLDSTVIGKQLFVRSRKTGDKFQPLGMKLTKTLQNFMVDIKIPVAQRSQVPILCSLQQIYWIVGYRIDERAKITSDTKEVLRIKFSRLYGTHRD